MYLKTIATHLVRPGATEFALASGRAACVKIDGTLEAVDARAATTVAVLETLRAAGGARFVDHPDLPGAEWSIRLRNVGTLKVVAMRRGDRIHARFLLVKANTQTPPARKASIPPSKRASMAPASKAAPRKTARPPKRASLAPPAPAPAAPRRERASGFPAFLPEAARVAPGHRAEAHEARPAHAPAERARRSVPPKSVAPPRRPATPEAHFEALLVEARARGASDLHVVAGRPALLRLVGDLVPEGDPIDAKAAEAMIMPLVPPRLVAVLIADGSCDFALDSPDGRARVNVSRQRTGLKACLRLIPREVPTLASLGLPPEIASATRHHQGLIVVTGPTGHGKTTTMAALVDLINEQSGRHVITVEDPVEYVHPRKHAIVSQREVGSCTKSFQSALKGALREDPDVIVVGELRDVETVKMAIAAAETGHLVLGTMNTPSAARTIDALIDLFPPGDQQQVRLTLAGGLHLVVSQRLVPDATGEGRVAAVELLPGSIALWNLIRDAKTFQIPSLQQRGRAMGVVRLDDSLAELVAAGRTTLEAALPFATAPDELLARVGRRDAPAADAAAPLLPNLPPPPATPGARNAGLFSRAGSLFGKKG